MEGRTTHFPFLGNNQNYIRGKLNIDQDDLFVGGSTVTTMTGRLYCNGSLNIATNNWVYDSDGNQRFYCSTRVCHHYTGDVNW